MFYDLSVDLLSRKEYHQMNLPVATGHLWLSNFWEKRQMSNEELYKLLLSVISPITSPHWGVGPASYDVLICQGYCNVFKTEPESLGKAFTAKTLHVDGWCISISFYCAETRLAAATRSKNHIIYLPVVLTSGLIVENNEMLWPSHFGGTLFTVYTYCQHIIDIWLKEQQKQATTHNVCFRLTCSWAYSALLRFNMGVWEGNASLRVGGSFLCLNEMAWGAKNISGF